MKKIIAFILVLLSVNVLAKGGGGHSSSHSSSHSGHSSSHSFSEGYSHGSAIRSSGSIYHPYLFHTTLMPHPYVAGLSDGTDEQPDNIPNTENDTSWTNYVIGVLYLILIALLCIAVT